MLWCTLPSAAFAGVHYCSLEILAMPPIARLLAEMSQMSILALLIHGAKACLCWHSLRFFDHASFGGTSGLNEPGVRPSSAHP